MNKKVEIDLSLLRLICKHFTVSYDSYTDRIEPACHHDGNKPNGDSWGICSIESCPYLRAEERHE